MLSVLMLILQLLANPLQVGQFELIARQFKIIGRCDWCCLVSYHLTVLKEQNRVSFCGQDGK
jgi:hypothetical protein